MYQRGLKGHGFESCCWAGVFLGLWNLRWRSPTTLNHFKIIVYTRCFTCIRCVRLVMHCFTCQRCNMYPLTKRCIIVVSKERNEEDNDICTNKLPTQSKACCSHLRNDRIKDITWPSLCQVYCGNSLWGFPKAFERFVNKVLFDWNEVTKNLTHEMKINTRNTKDCIWFKSGKSCPRDIFLHDFTEIFAKKKWNWMELNGWSRTRETDWRPFGKQAMFVCLQSKYFKLNPSRGKNQTLYISLESRRAENNWR